MPLRKVIARVSVLMAVLAVAQSAPAETRLSTDGSRFAINGQPAFLLGISYYGALGASDESIDRDLADMKRLGLNWIRVWANWSAFDNDVSAVAADGSPRQEYLDKLQRLVADCDALGIIVDVTLTRGNGVTGPPRLQTLAAHARAVETVVAALKPHANWYLDLANERNIQDARFASYDDLKQLRELVGRLDSGRLVTASQGGDIDRDELRKYLLKVNVDFIAPHRPRDAASAGQTEAKTREYLTWMRELGREAPVHYQEPFRRGYAEWQPKVEDFARDLAGAKAGGAAGWCLHNGDTRAAQDGHPRRSFDMRSERLFEQLDAEEQEVVRRVGNAAP